MHMVGRPRPKGIVPPIVKKIYPILIVNLNDQANHFFLFLFKEKFLLQIN